MIKKHEFNYIGMSKDSSNDIQSEKYFDAQNIRITALDKKSQMAVTNELGNELVFNIPTPSLDFQNTRFVYNTGGKTKYLEYVATGTAHPRCEIEQQFIQIPAVVAKVSGDQIIIGVKELRDSAVIMTTDNNGWDCIWELTGLNDSSFELNLKYAANLGFSTDNLMQMVYNYENSIIEKIYFVDGIHQIRYLNLRQSIDNGDLINLVDLSPSLLDIVSTFTLEQPVITEVLGGGSHTAGKIQYAYGLFVLNGAQTTPSPLSELVPIDKGQGLGGGDVNENLGQSVVVKITNIDPKFTHVRLYAIKYTSYNEIPRVTVVAEREIDNFVEFTYTDDGTSQEEISIEAFKFLGSSPIVPEHIVTKDNRLFPVNIKESIFDVDLDTRAFSFGTSTGSVQTSTFRVFGENNADSTGDIVMQVEDVVYYIPILINDTPQLVANKMKTFFDTTLSDYGPAVITEVSPRNFSIQITRNTIGNFPASLTVEKQRELFFRASSVHGTGTDNNCIVLNNAFYSSDDDEVQGEETIVTAPDYTLIDNHDAINRDYDVYKYQADGTTLGASGKFLDVEFVQTQYNNLAEAEDLELMKDGEIYRLGIKFYNNRGQFSNPKWIMDFRSQADNLNSLHNEIHVKLTSDFYLWLSNPGNFTSDDDKPVGFKVLRADRNLSDQTIFAQGMINPMVAHYVHESKATDLDDRITLCTSTTADIFPSMVRKFTTERPIVGCKNYHELSWPTLDSDNPTQLPTYPFPQTAGSRLTGGGYSRYLRETFTANEGKYYRAQSFQFNTMMQFFSPDVLFKDVSINAGYKLKIKGLTKEGNIFNWSTEENPLTSSERVSCKYIGGITRGAGVGTNPIIGNESFLNDYGFYGPTNDTVNIATQQVSRNFTEGFFPAQAEDSNLIHEVYGTPEITIEGADLKRYNSDPALKYANNLKNMLQDKFDGDIANDDADVQIIGVNSNGAKCVTFALGPDDSTYELENRPAIEDLYEQANIKDGEGDGVLIAEFVRDDYISYVGGIYGGTSYEAKRNSSYVEIGQYTTIQNDAIITSPGDTFVNYFTFTKIAKDDLQNTTQSQNIVSEIVSFLCETTIDLKNRNDLSSGPWDGRKQPRHSEYTNYNRVYSQQPILTAVSDLGAKFKRVSEFDTRISATKVKVPGEFIDSWTDLLENENMDLDGQYGPINAVVMLNDEVFCLQDTAVSMIAINPRVQIQGDDGIGLELGTGGILNDYKYLTSTIGCLNKFGVVATENTFYFVDVINRGIMAFNGGKIVRFSDLKGFHHTLLDDMNYDSLIKDNPVLGNGVTIGYNPSSADVYFSFRQILPSNGKRLSGDFTLGFNEAVGEFTSYYSYVPAWYINKGSTLITSGPETNSVWQHLVGTPNSFYDKTYRSSITLQVAPKGNEVILNSASYKLEGTNKFGKDLPTVGLTKVEVYNDYQTSGEVALRIRKNVFKKFRNWKVTLPREKDKRERIRSAWGFVKFIFDNPDGNNLVLHNISIFYTQH